MAKVRPIKFPGNPRPAVRHGELCVIVIMPVVRIERDERDDADKRVGRFKRSTRRGRK